MLMSSWPSVYLKPPRPSLGHTQTGCDAAMLANERFIPPSNRSLRGAHAPPNTVLEDWASPAGFAVDLCRLALEPFGVLKGDGEVLYTPCMLLAKVSVIQSCPSPNF